MEKLNVYFVFFFLVPVIYGESKNTCYLSDRSFLTFNNEWKSMVSSCTLMMRTQVQMELTASMTYLAMGSHFLQDTVNRPGLAKFFLDSASEERQHAIKLIEYLLMRGELTTKSEFEKIIDNPKPVQTSWTSGFDALKAALDLEVQVTNKIRDIVIQCENPSEPEKTNTNSQSTLNDYHLVDWLTGVFLDEQYKGQRELAGKISTLGKMMKNHGALGEFLFDKSLL